MTREPGRERHTGVSVELGVLLAMVGGFLDAYSVIGLGGVFANAQTGNVVLFGVEAAGGYWRQAVRHVPPILAFMLGVAVAEILWRPRVVAALRWPARAALVLEILVLTVVGLLPAGTLRSVKVIMIAFAASVQVSTFRTLITWTYNTTMMTGNLRSASRALFLALVDHDPEAAGKARHFGVIILSFLTGGIIGGWLTLRVGGHAVWAAAGVLVVALGLFVVDEHRGVLSRARGATATGGGVRPSSYQPRTAMGDEMAEQEPVTELGAAFSSQDAVPAEWERGRGDLRDAQVYWLTTVRPDGRPHVTPLLGVWLDGALYFCTGPAERKAKNLARNPQCVLTTGRNELDGLDLVVEGEAAKVGDEAELRSVAGTYESKYGRHFTAPEGTWFGLGDAIRGGEVLVYRVAPSTAFGFGKGGRFSQTRWRFRSGR
jgi:uncharacterized membrane protein YoaK (UPF0700 family)/general stress protein 26